MGLSFFSLIVVSVLFVYTHIFSLLAFSYVWKIRKTIDVFSFFVKFLLHKPLTRITFVSTVYACIPLTSPLSTAIVVCHTYKEVLFTTCKLLHRFHFMLSYLVAHRHHHNRTRGRRQNTLWWLWLNERWAPLWLLLLPFCVFVVRLAKRKWMFTFHKVTVIRVIHSPKQNMKTQRVVVALSWEQKH